MVAIEHGLKVAGFVIGRNVTIEHRFAEGRNAALPMLAGGLARMEVNVIFANTTPPARAAKEATTTIPIVFVTGVVVASFNRPGANVTGVMFLSNKLVAKRLELLSNLVLVYSLVPETAPIGMLAAQHNPNKETDVRDALAAAKALGRDSVRRKGSAARWHR